MKPIGSFTESGNQVVSLAFELSLRTLTNVLIGLFAVLVIGVVILYFVEMNSD
jgi:hypothetical protein